MIYAVTALSGILFALGGYHWLWCRRFVMPIMLTGACFWITHNPWCLTMLSSIVFLSLGYGDNSMFRHVFGDGPGRGVWGTLVALSLSLALFLTGWLAWYWFGLYLILGFALEDDLRSLSQLVGDAIIGCAFGSLVILVHHA